MPSLAGSPSAVASFSPWRRSVQPGSLSGLRRKMSSGTPLDRGSGGSCRAAIDFGSTRSRVPCLRFPRSKYRLVVDGLVRRPTILSLGDLEAMPSTKIVKDFQCVTGWRVPDVHWEGVRLSEVLDQVGVLPEAVALSFDSYDGADSESLTLDQARLPDLIVAYRMLGAPVTTDTGDRCASTWLRCSATSHSNGFPRSTSWTRCSRDIGSRTAIPSTVGSTARLARATRDSPEVRFDRDPRTFTVRDPTTALRRDAAICSLGQRCAFQYPHDHCPAAVFRVTCWHGRPTPPRRRDPPVVRARPAVADPDLAAWTLGRSDAK